MAEYCCQSAESPFLSQGHDPECQVRRIAVWQGKETAVVNQEFEAEMLMAEIPADPPLSCCAFSGR
jgi:hypothetical protein